MNLLKSFTYRYNNAFNKKANDVFAQEHKHIDEQKFGFFFESRHFARTLEKYGAVFTVNGDVLQVQIRGINFNVTLAEELFILYEIFCTGCYSFNTAGNCVVIDIGMNVGMASLYFASIPEVKKVYSFEPFKTTYHCGINNLKNNPLLSDKIVAANYGLGNEDTTLQVSYSKEWKGSNGVDGSTRPDMKNKTLEFSESIELKNAADVFERISKEENCPIMVKMDCEGGEYPIFESLKNWDFNNVIGFMIEWHFKGADQIINILKDKGFVTYSLLPNPEEQVGMLYAIKSIAQ